MGSSWCKNAQNVQVCLSLFFIQFVRYAGPHPIYWFCLLDRCSVSLLMMACVLGFICGNTIQNTLPGKVTMDSLFIPSLNFFLPPPPPSLHSFPSFPSSLFFPLLPLLLSAPPLPLHISPPLPPPLSSFLYLPSLSLLFLSLTLKVPKSTYTRPAEKDKLQLAFKSNRRKAEVCQHILYSHSVM